MRSTTIPRRAAVVACTVLAAASFVVGAGPAAARPPSDLGGTCSVVRDSATPDGCGVEAATRRADVDGRVTVRIPDLGVKAYLPEGVGDLWRTKSGCRDAQA
jgi:hypothetical protein